MLILSSGMPKAGTGYIYNVLNDLLIASGNADAREIKKSYDLGKILKWENNNIESLHDDLVKIVDVSKNEKSFVIKTHSRPSEVVRELLMKKLIKVVYIYRDPRDVLISARNHGEKSKAAGVEDIFQQMIDFEVGMEKVKRFIFVYEQYKSMKDVLMISYEELLGDKLITIKKIINYIGITVSEEKIAEILFTYDRNNPKLDKGKLHYNKGVSGRYKSEFTEKQVREINDVLKEKILMMGYSL